MKYLLTSTLIIFFTVKGTGQAVQYPTVREIYNFAVGDTFEYNSGNYFVQIVTNRIDYGNDSIVYSFNSYHQGIAGMQQLSQVITYLDSIFSYPFLLQFCYEATPFSCYPVQDTFLLESTDTLYQVRAGKSILYPACDDDGYPDGLTDTAQENDLVQYGKGLGVVLWEDQIADPTCGIFDGGEQLSYVHKVNGTVWGTPFYFPLGIYTIPFPDLSFEIFPNPASGEFTLQLNRQPLKELIFRMYDASGRLVTSKIINSASTIVNRGGLGDGNGVYSYTLELEGQIVREGKLILD